MAIDRRTYLRLSAAAAVPAVPAVPDAAATARAATDDSGYGLTPYGEDGFGTVTTTSTTEPTGYDVGAHGAGAYASGGVS